MAIIGTTANTQPNTPGAGALEVGGLTVWQGLEIIRGPAGLNIIGTDLVEVSRRAIWQERRP